MHCKKNTFVVMFLASTKLCSLSTQVALGALGTVVALFLYLVLYLPRIQKRHPDVSPIFPAPYLRQHLTVLKVCPVESITRAACSNTSKLYRQLHCDPH